MSRSISWLMIAGALALAGLFATEASATTARTFVSGGGSDIGVCSRSAPCKTFAYAILQTDDGGEISVLDSGDFGPVSISQSISIVNDGAGTASVTGPASSAAVTINTGASAMVHLRGLSFDGAGGTAYGILFEESGSLDIRNCVFRHFTYAGIYSDATNVNSFSIENTIVSDNGFAGIYLAPYWATTGVIDHVAATGNVYGILVSGGHTSEPVDVTIVDSVAANNSVYGILGSSTLRLSRSVVTGNGNTGVYSDSSDTLLTYRDNDISGNTTDVFGTLTPLAKR